jgi:hypothetical protein
MAQPLDLKAYKDNPARPIGQGIPRKSFVTRWHVIQHEVSPNFGAKLT